VIFNDLKEIANELAFRIKNGGRHVFFLDGEMGAGKTTLVSSVLSKYDTAIKVTSPTFTIINQYMEDIFHIDLYRLENADDFSHLGLGEILGNDNIVFIEWCSMMGQKFEELARPYTHIKIDKISEEKREFTLSEII